MLKEYQSFLSSLLIIFLGVSPMSCGSPQARKQGLRGQSGADITQTGAREFKLSWMPPKGKVTRFHVFYTQGNQTNKGGNEIDSIEVSPALLKSPLVVLNETNIDPFPKEKGSKLCFYIVHGNGDLRSDPSSVVCGTLDDVSTSQVN
jgi:hypothetical protein